MSTDIESFSTQAQTGSRLLDSFGRVHDSLRLSVTDRCNLRCLYCMPESAPDFEDAASLLSFGEIERVVRVLASMGVSKVRLTGGEPTVRASLVDLVARISAVSGIRDLAMTTNGMRLDTLAEPLRRAGLQRLNISLDALTDEAFYRVTRRKGLSRVLAGIDAALRADYEEVRLNALAIRGLNEDQVVPLARFAKDRGLTLRFIEYMPLGGDRSWRFEQVLTGAKLRDRLEEEFGALTPVARPHPSQPATDFAYADGVARVGFINPVSQPFCDACNRIRLTAGGALRNCLFCDREWHLAPLLRGDALNAELLRAIRQCLAAKEAGHLISQPAFHQPARPMYQIGG